MSIAFIQHGKTPSREAGLIAHYGEWLSNKGRLDASKAGSAVLELLGAQPDSVIASPTRRTRETAAIAFGLDDTGFSTDVRMEPRDMGMLIGAPAADVPWDDEAALRDLGVEPLDQLVARHEDLYAELREGDPDRAVVLVGHSSSISILARLAMLPPERANLKRDEVLLLA